MKPSEKKSRVLFHSKCYICKESSSCGGTIGPPPHLNTFFKKTLKLIFYIFTFSLHHQTVWRGRQERMSSNFIFMKNKSKVFCSLLLCCWGLWLKKLSQHRKAPDVIDVFLSNQMNCETGLFWWRWQQVVAYSSWFVLSPSSQATRKNKLWPQLYPLKFYQLWPDDWQQTVKPSRWCS